MSGAEIVISLVAVAVGAVVQGSIGFGFALVAVPVMGILEPRSLPATMLILSFPLTVWMAMHERHAVDIAGLVHIIPGRIVGTVAGAWVVGVLSVRGLSVLIGGVIVFAVVLSVLAPHFEAGTRSRAVAGLLSGFMATAAAVGGPPLALAYQRRPGPELRSTLAASFVIGTVISVVALWIARRVDGEHVVRAAQLVPGLVVGLVVAARLRDRLDASWLRPSVLAFAAISGIAAIANGLL